jgi:two-component system, OmpR family, response regulator ResD
MGILLNHMTEPERLPKLFKILLVDPQKDFCELFKIEFEHLGFGVLAAHDVAEGLWLVREEKPDVILLDGQLRGSEDSLTFLRKLRTFRDADFEIEEKIRQTPVLIFTADTSNLKDLFDLETVAGYVEKPFDTKQLWNLLVQVITGSKSPQLKRPFSPAS